MLKEADEADAAGRELSAPARAREGKLRRWATSYLPFLVKIMKVKRGRRSWNLRPAEKKKPGKEEGAREEGRHFSSERVWKEAGSRLERCHLVAPSFFLILFFFSFYCYKRVLLFLFLFLPLLFLVVIVGFLFVGCCCCGVVVCYSFEGRSIRRRIPERLGVYCAERAVVFKDA